MNGINYKKYKLKDILFEHKIRNKDNKISEVFSVAKNEGVVNQIKHLGRSYASDDISNYKAVFSEDIAYTKSPTAGFPFGIIKKNKTDRIGVVSVLYAVFRPKTKSFGFLVDQYFSSQVRTFNYLIPLVHKGAKNTMNISNTSFLNGRSIFFPESEEERKKLCEFLSSVDCWIKNLEKQKKSLRVYKRSVVRKIFLQKISFKDENGTNYPIWENKSFKEVFKRVKRKNKVNNQNVLTISAQDGLINQRDYFKRSVAAKDITGYYLLHKNEFAYNKSYSNGYPMGAIKKLNIYDKGVVSTLYICFKLIDERMSVDFFEQYFEAGQLNREINKIAQEGARAHGLLNMSIFDFFDSKISAPSAQEQEKIASFLSSIDKLINSKNKQITKAKEWKKGLLQQMFV